MTAIGPVLPTAAPAGSVPGMRSSNSSRAIGRATAAGSITIIGGTVIETAISGMIATAVKHRVTTAIVWGLEAEKQSFSGMNLPTRRQQCESL